MTGVGAAAGQFGKNLLRRAERKIVEHDNDVLDVAGIFFARDHRRGQQLLFAESVRVHPVRAGCQLEVVSPGCSDRQRSAVRAGTVLIGWCLDLPMPMHLKWLTGRIENIAGESIAFLGEKARFAAGPDHAENLYRFFVDLDRARADR